MLRISVLAVAATLALAPACKSRTPRGADAAAPGERGPGGAISAVALPSPHPLEASPQIGAYVRDPAAALDVARATLPGVPSLAEVAGLVLASQAPAEVAEGIAPMIAERRPWAAAIVAGEEILHLPLLPDQTDAAVKLLARYPAEGKFGAVQLPGAAVQLPAGGVDGPPPRPRLAWVDRQHNALAIAETLEGLVTARELPRGYGSQPVWLSAAGAKLSEYVDFPYARVSASGTGLDDLTITIEADPQRGLPRSPELAAGALTNLHAGDALALAASTRWARHEVEVKGIIRQIRAQVDAAGFAAKMMLQPLADQAITVLKSWNGRVFVGIGPSRHLALALGADEPMRAGQALARFLKTAIDNLELARMFVSDVPKLSLRRHSKSPEIHVLTMQGARKQVPQSLGGLLDERGSLKVAFSFTPKSGAVFMTIGADAETAIAAWAESIEAAPPASESAGDLIAVTVALSPGQLQELLGRADPNDASALMIAGLDLGAGRPPTQLVIREEADRYVVTSKGPASTVAPLRQGRGQ
ncbi:MAG: hypothetical protein H6710_21290 [Myxococcales bacterium]|nr:hypothetical protein [Myxococcales bacterium]MCB9700524.1 hypothetical protein [Myxococcales bacterium]